MRQGYLLGLLWAALAITHARAQDAKPFARFEVKGEHRFITKTVFSPDGKTFAPAHCSRFGPIFVTFWDSTNGKRIREINGTEGVYNWNPVVFSPNGIWLAVGGYDEFLLLHANGKLADRVILEHTQVEHLAFTPNTDVLISCSWLDGLNKNPGGDNIILWNVVTKAEKTSLKKKAAVRLDRDRVVGLALSPDAKTMTTVGHDLDIDAGWMVRLWDFSTLKTIRTFTGKKNDRFESVELSSDGRVLAVLKEDVVELSESADGTLMRTIKSQGENWNMHFTKDGSAVVMLNLQVKKEKVVGAEVELTDIQSGKVLATRKLTSRPGEKDFGPNLAISPDGKLVAFQVDEFEFAIWRSAELIGVPLSGKKKN